MIKSNTESLPDMVISFAEPSSQFSYGNTNSEIAFSVSLTTTLSINQLDAEKQKQSIRQTDRQTDRQIILFDYII